MAQFKITDWCDFVRGVADPELEAAMRREVEAGAAPTQILDMLGLVAEVGRLDSAMEIPEFAVRVAKAAGTVARPESFEAEESRWDPRRLFRYLPVSITFDSFSMPSLTAGTRSLQTSDRRLSARAEAFAVDLRLEHDHESHCMVVVGQLMREAEEASDPVAEVAVLALQDGRIVGRSKTGQFGEFEAEGLPAQPDRLCFLVGPEECIDIPLGLE